MNDIVYIPERNQDDSNSFTDINTLMNNVNTLMNNIKILESLIELVNTKLKEDINNSKIGEIFIADSEAEFDEMVGVSGDYFEMNGAEGLLASAYPELSSAKPHWIYDDGGVDKIRIPDWRNRVLRHYGPNTGSPNTLNGTKANIGDSQSDAGQRIQGKFVSLYNDTEGAIRNSSKRESSRGGSTINYYRKILDTYYSILPHKAKTDNYETHVAGKIIAYCVKWR